MTKKRGGIGGASIKNKEEERERNAKGKCVVGIENESRSAGHLATGRKKKRTMTMERRFMPSKKRVELVPYGHDEPQFHHKARELFHQKWRKQESKYEQKDTMKNTLQMRADK